MSLVVARPGLLSTLQDAGRRGHALAGVGHAGPMDEVAFRLANALVGNDGNAPAIEFGLLGPVLRFERDATVALAGAAPQAMLDGVAAPAWRPFTALRGSVLDTGRLRHGAFAYLAIAGGFACECVLGSAATDVNAALGPRGGRTLRAGDRLDFDAGEVPFHTHGWSLDPRPWFDPDPHRPLRAMRGTHFDALDAASRHALFEAEFRVRADSNRVGLRLDGPPLALAAPRELASEAVARGTLQLPPGGQPIALMAEHPTTGGYPRIAQVAAVDLPRLAQRRAGQPLRFAPIDIDEAQSRYLRREHELARLCDAIRERLRR